MRKKQHGFTLIEMVLAVSLTSIVLVAGTRMFSFSLGETSKAQTKTALGLQATDLLNRIREEISTSMYCETRTVTGGTALLCAKPDQSNSLNGDAWPDEWLPSTVLSEGVPRFRPGRYSWLYQSDGSGNPNAASGTFVSRLASTRDLFTLTGNTLDTKFLDNPSQSGTQNPWSALQSIQFTPDPLTRSVTVTVVLSSRIGNPQVVSTSATGSSVMRITETRTFFWRNGR